MPHDAPTVTVGNTLAHARHQAISVHASQKATIPLHSHFIAWWRSSVEASTVLTRNVCGCSAVHSHSGTMTAELPMVDTRIDMKLLRFSGRDEDWSDECHWFEAYGALLGYDTQMHAAAVRPTPITAQSLGDPCARSIEELVAGNAKEEDQGAVALVLDLAKALRVSLPVVWAWATHFSFPRNILRVLCGYFEHQKRVQFEGCSAGIEVELLASAYCTARCAE